MEQQYKYGEKVQLFCVGYAGSIAANFNLLIPYFSSKIEFVTVEYRGRGTRIKENKYIDNDDMAKDVAERIRVLRKPELPYAILGYSMGAQVVYEMFAQGFLEEVPICTFLAAHEPPDVDCFGKNFDLTDNRSFLEQLKIYGGMDERLLQDDRFIAIYGARMKEDFSLLKAYSFNGEYHMLLSKVVVLYCEKDTPYEKMKGWGKFSTSITFYEMGENHFFFKNNPEEFCSTVSREIEKYWDGYYE